MIEVWSWPTPNGHKVHIALEELGLEYGVIPVNIGAGDQFKSDLDAEMVAIAGAIIRQRTGNFDPSTYHDRYQEALRRLIEAKMKRVTIEPRTVSTPSPVIDLMAALKRSLAQEPSAPEQRTAKRKQTKKAPDRRQPALLLPLTGARKKNQRVSSDPAVTSIKKRNRGT